MLQKFLEKILGKLLDHPKRVFLALTVSAVLFTALSFRLRLNEDLLEMLPSDFPEVSDYKKVLKNFNPLDVLYIDLSLKDLSAPGGEALIPKGDHLYKDLLASNLFSKISYKWNIDDGLALADVLRSHRPAYFTKEYELDCKEKINAESIHATLGHWKRLFLETPAPMLASQFQKDPLGIDQILWAKIQSLQSMGENTSNLRNRLFSKDKKHLLLITHPLHPSSDTQYTRTLVEFLNSINAKYESDGYQFRYLGGHRFAFENARDMERDVSLATTISLFAIMALAIAVFRRPLVPLLTLIPLYIGTAFAFSLMPLFTDEIALIVIGCGSILFGVAVDYGIHILFHMDQHDKPDKKTITHIMSHLISPMMVSCLTTMAAFLCLQGSMLPSYRHFGVFAALGLIGSLIAAILLLPCVSLYLPQKPKKAFVENFDWIPNFFQFVMRHRKLVYFILIAFTLFSVFSLSRIEFDGEPKNLYSSSPEIDEDLAIIDASFGHAMSTSSVIVQAKTLEQALIQNDKVLTQLHSEFKDGRLDSYQSLANFIPSQQDQLNNQKRYQKFWSKDQIALVKKRLAREGKKLGFNQDMLDAFMESLASPNHEALTLESFTNTPLESLIGFQTSISKNETLILSTFKLKPEQVFKEFKNDFTAKFPNAIVLNGSYFVSRMVELIFTELKRLGLITLLCTTIILSLVYGPRFAVPMVFPLLISLCWTFGALSALGIRINILNCVVTLFVFALVIDYSVFLTSAFKSFGLDFNSVELRRSFTSITISALTTLFGVGALAIAQHPAIRTIGITVLIGISCGLLAVTLIVPLTVRSQNKRG